MSDAGGNTKYPVKTGEASIAIPSGVRRRRDDAFFSAHGDDVWGMTTASALAVVRVDRAALEGGHGAFKAARLVQGVRVDDHLLQANTSLLSLFLKPVFPFFEEEMGGTRGGEEA